jgi:hypothetical protein
VTTAGSYSITTDLANGVRFAASGTLTTTGPQTITLIASGTPTPTGTYTYTINTTPSASFTGTTIHASTNGTAIVTAYTISGTHVGRLVKDRSVSNSGVVLRVNATVSKAGTYSITTNTFKGITFSGSGTFTTTGSRFIPLYASGKPTDEHPSGSSWNLTTSIKVSGGFFRRIFPKTDHASSNGTAVLSDFNIGTLSGTMTASVPVSDVTQTFTVTATPPTDRTYILTTNTVNGVTFSSGPVNTKTITAGSNIPISLKAYGTPIAAGTFTYTIDGNSGLTFSVTVQPPPQ